MLRSHRMNSRSERKTVMMPGTAGIPFSARYEQTMVEPLDHEYSVRQIRWGAIYRDGQGRVRNEVEKNAGEGNRLHTAEIYDPVGRCFYLLDLLANTIRSVRLPSRNKRRDSSVAPVINEASHGVEDLGEKEIEGVRCRGKRVTREGEVTDYWYSPELRHLLLKETARDDKSRQTYRLYDIRLEEPDPSLFIASAKPESPITVFRNRRSARHRSPNRGS